MKGIGFSIALPLTINGNSVQAGLDQSLGDGCFEEKDVTLYEVKEKAKFKTGGGV